MTSEIRTNSITSRAGLSTVTLTDSGPMFSGITTFVDNSTFSVGTGGTIHAPATNTLNIGVNNTESLRIDSNSNLKVAGIVTATHFHGDGSNLTGITQTTINNQQDNYVVTATGTANTLRGEPALTFDGATLDIDGGTNDTPLILDTSNTAGSHLRFRKDGSNKHFVGCGGGFSLGDVDDLSLRTVDNIIFGVGTSEKVRIDSNGYLSFAGDTDTYIHHPQANQLAITIAGGSFPIVRFGTGGSGSTVGFSTDSTLVTNSERMAVRGVSSFKSTSSVYAPIYTHNEGNTSGTYNAHLLWNAGGANRGGIGYMPNNGELIFNNQNAINFATGSTHLSGTTRLTIKSDGAIVIPDGTQGLRFGSAGSQDFAIFHSGANSHIDHFGTGNLYQDFSNDFHMRFYQSAGVVRTALYVSNGGSSNPEFQLWSNPTSAPTNSGTHSPSVRFKGAGWNTYSGSVEVGTILQSEHYYWQSSVSNVFGQTYPDFKMKMKNSDNGSYVSKFIFSGNGNAAFNGSLTQNSSDIRLKENIQPISNSLEKVKSLSGFTYNWNKTAQDLGFKGGGHDELQVGLSAQDVEKIQPEVVKPAPVDNSYKTIQYEKLVPLLVEAIKEQQKQIEILEQENIALRARVTNLEGE